MHFIDKFIGKLTKFYQMLKLIYKPRYIALNLLLAIVYYAIFLYLAYVQGGNAVMTSNWPLAFALIITSSIVMTIAVYSMKNRISRNAKISGSVGSVSTIVLGTGLCGCATTFLPTIATVIGVGTAGVFGLSRFLSDYSVGIFSAMIMLNLLIAVYYINKLSGRKQIKRVS